MAEAASDPQLPISGSKYALPWWAKVVAILVCVAVAILVCVLAAALVLPRFVEWPGGMSPTYHAKDSDPRLTRIARTALPIIAALEKCHEVTGSYPEDYEGLRNYLADGNDIPAIVNKYYAHHGWLYEKFDVGYVLSYRLGWDPDLLYRSEQKEWVFQPGDGSPDKTIKLDVR